ncbi:IST1 homolog isoform X1 [Anopheles cruzii]|uniref:IST1 homolog isoform X1 n=1 Tax=Anopheles cruzii TaxID=68878 RepID=UPI0022EC56D9|nr:IST1 homolog isoform X1 [Anopheles cruzii]XP_052872234.1 IST1 homolog isoform X1 [Anopheles cruzii]
MFSSAPNYTKLKTNLRLAVNRLKLLEKKKSELAQKARKEIAEYLEAGKPERAKIRVEHIIREDYLVEAMEIVEMYCDLILARFGMVTQMKELDEGIEEAVSSIIWVAPRLQADVQELKICSDIFTAKYGKQYAEQVRAAIPPHKVSDKLMHKLAIKAPARLLVEKYLIEIASIFDVDYNPDPTVMKDDRSSVLDSDDILIDLADKNNLDGSSGGASGGGGSSGSGGASGGGGSMTTNTATVPPSMGFVAYPPAIPQLPTAAPVVPFQYPAGPSGMQFGGASAPPFNYNIPPNSSEKEEIKDLNINSNFIKEEKGASDTGGPPPCYASLSPDDNMQNSTKPKPQPRSKFSPELNFPPLPNVPLDLPDIPDDNENKNADEDTIDFDDLSRRFEELKKKK